MSKNRPALFRGRHFEDVIIILCVRWYLRYSLSYRDLQEIMTERGLSVNHVTICTTKSLLFLRGATIFSCRLQELIQLIDAGSGGRQNGHEGALRFR